MPQVALPPIPETPVQEGARWRHHRPPSEAVAHWFETQPLDDGMTHDQFVGGVVLIPQNEKVKYPKPDGSGTIERYEQVFTPYVQIGTRVAYFRRLAEYRELIPVIEPVQVPRSQRLESPYFNGNMPDGLWWHVVRSGDGEMVKYLCATYRVAMYEPMSYVAKLKGENPLPMVSGEGTKQVSGGADPNGLMKAQTGAIGRALGVAGMLVVGTGIATAEDMQEYTAQPSAADAVPELPTVPSEVAGQPMPPADPQEALSQLRARALQLQGQMQEAAPEAWKTFAAWWQERRSREGWQTLDSVPFEALKGIVSRMERELAAAERQHDTPSANGETGVVS